MPQEDIVSFLEDLGVDFDEEEMGSGSTTFFAAKMD